MKDKKTKRSKIILLSSIFQIVLLLLMIGLFILKMNSLNLWIQGITDMSVFFIIWIIFSILFITQQIGTNKIKKSDLSLVLTLGIFIIVIISIFIENNNYTYNSYYEEDNQVILVVREEKMLTGNIKFYSKSGILFAEEFASCTNMFSVSCDYYIDGIYLIVNISGGGDIQEIKYEIPTE